jgi:hypothetical protein
MNHTYEPAAFLWSGRLQADDLLWVIEALLMQHRIAAYLALIRKIGFDQGADLLRKGFSAIKPTEDESRSIELHSEIRWYCREEPKGSKLPIDRSIFKRSMAFRYSELNLAR